ncbi:MAG: DUF4339 domain-containing protein [Planctomycetes bacterium]|nr:DUF4339 domain-containing protein [Planctomycetota bacterium]
MSEATWYHAKDGTALGPFTLTQLREMVVAGNLGPAELLCRVGETEWVPAQGVPGLFPPPPPLPGAKRKLVPCAKCKVVISDEAETCPHCGECQPKWEQKEYGWTGESCEKCGVFNIVSTGYGQFREWQNCRGCGCPLTEASPSRYTESEMDKVHANSKAAGIVLGVVGAVVSFIAYWSVSGIDGGGLVVRLLVAAAGFFLTYFAIVKVIRVRGARAWFSDRSPRADQMTAHSWDLCQIRYHYSNAFRRASTTANAVPASRTIPEIVATIASWGCAIVFVIYLALALGAALFLDRSPPKPELPVDVSFRTSDVGKGMVLKMRNTSAVPLKDLSFTITNQGGKKAGEISKVLLKPLEPQATFEVGWVELGGWELSPGETIKIWMPSGNYKPIEVTVPAKAPSR